MKKYRAFLKWAGGKYPLLDDIKRHLPEGECLIEPFVGAGSVFLNTDYSRYVLSDINSDLISLYTTVKDKTDDYVSEARLLFTAEHNQAEVYYQLREEFNQSRDEFRRALLFLYLNRHGYNGLCRYNLRGEFNVPFGRYKKPYFPETELYHFAERAQSALFICESYDASMARAQQENSAVVYCDPPYAPLSATANFTAYHTNSFNLEQQRHLAQLAEDLQSQRIPVLISNHDTELTRQWYQQAKLHKVRVRRSISSNGGTRRKGGRTAGALRSLSRFRPPYTQDLMEKRMKQYLIAPSILSADFARLGEDTARVLAAGADVVHFDVMDNHYVPNLTIGPMVLKALRDYGITAPIDVHLMVKPVDRLIPDFADAGASIITFHPEASEHIDRSLQLIKEHGCKAGLVFNPATPLSYLDYVMDKLDVILLMSVNPGFGGQSFIPQTLEKLKEVRQRIDAPGVISVWKWMAA
ncbi:Methyl-directed repair DNA adenine methylase [Cronobacter dublinensis 1210]|uniref:Ribulose-phosphate 3-epimerase n=2 Tax=Cronobacter TaxID=413496 RepID=A0ABM9Q7E1_9ENTR|nr:Methyl-directed repair DNA adenine methylase [Cronobacter dublinensis 1210]